MFLTFHNTLYLFYWILPITMCVYVHNTAVKLHFLDESVWSIGTLHFSFVNVHQPC